MPSPDNLPGFMLKKEACALYDRSLRQLTRDFDKAALKGETEFLASFKLALEDGTILEANEVTKEQIQQFRDKGLNPTWFVRESWMREKYGLRGDKKPTPAVSRAAEPEAAKDTEEGSRPETGDPSILIQSKDDLITLLREQNEFLRDRLEKETERSREDNELTRQLHVLLKNMQDRLLPEATADRAMISARPASPPQRPNDNLTAVVGEEDAASPLAGDKPKAKPNRGKPSTVSTDRGTKSAQKKAIPKPLSRVERMFPTFTGLLRKK